jgi:hypothetical protein
MIGMLQNDGLEAIERGSQRSGHSAGAAPQYDEIGLQTVGFAG